MTLININQETTFSASGYQKFLRRLLLRTFFIVVTLTPFYKVQAQTAEAKTFTNPLLPSGADPFSFYKDGYYFYMHTAGDRLVLWKTKNLEDLATAEKKVIFKPDTGKAWSKQLWAPEIHFIRGKWYVYFAADDGRNENHRLYVIENSSADPMKGEWVFRGKIGDSSDRWAIDGSVLQYKGKLYMFWSGWEGNKDGQQDIYIARMKSPVKISGKRVRLSSPRYDWERNGDLGGSVSHVNVNEGPQPLVNNDKLFLVYSASGCWTDYYALGMLTFSGKKDLLDSAAWHKSPKPVFSQNADNGVYAPGHNSFFKSPDGTEDWILYHANSSPGDGCGGRRSPRAQRFSWNDDGSPNFGVPVKPGVPLPVPSEKERIKRVILSE